MKKTFLTLTLTILALCSTAQESNNSTGIVFLHDTPWEELVAKATQAKKLIFIDCYTVWCGPCKGLDRNTFPVKEVGDFYNANFINVKYDMEQPQGINLKKMYPNDILNYPTLLFVDPTTKKIVHKFVGTRKPDEIIQEAKMALSGGGLVAIQAEYEAGNRELALVQKYVAALESAHQLNKLSTVIDNYFTQNASFNDLYKPEVWSGFGHYLFEAGIESQFVEFVFNNNQRLKKLTFVDGKKVDETLLDLLDVAATKLVRPIILENDSFCTIKQNDQQYRRLKQFLDRLDRTLPKNEATAKLAVYNLLAIGEWKEAFYAVKNARAFGFPYFNNSNIYLCTLAYIANQSKDPELVAGALKIALENQAEGEKRLQYYNVNNIIAYLYKCSGDKAKQSQYEQEFERVKTAKEKIIKPNNIKKHHS